MAEAAAFKKRPVSSSSVQVYLVVPFAEKDEAKSLGARWDATKKSWYAPQNVDVTVFKRWLPPGFDAAAPAVVAVKDSAKPFTTKPKDPDFMAYSGTTPPWE